MTSHLDRRNFDSYTPQSDANPIIPDAEDFAQWCEHPITRFVASAFKKSADQQRAHWDQVSWDHGRSDPLELTELRARADAYMAFLQTTRAQYVNILG